jgi:ribonuclease VapC
MVVDTSALVAIILDEPDAARCQVRLEDEDELLISAGTLTEALIVADRREVGALMRRLIGSLNLEVVGLTEAAARGAADAYSRWGKGVHPAGLNLADCFAYELASRLGCPLLFVGDDFARTDLVGAVGD